MTGITKIKVTDPKVLAGGLGASLATNVILVVQEFIPHWEPSVAFVGAAATLAGLLVGWIKRSGESEKVV